MVLTFSFVRVQKPWQGFAGHNLEGHVCAQVLKPLSCRNDVIPRISYASVETLLLEYASSSPFTSFGRKVKETLLAGLKVAS